MADQLQRSLKTRLHPIHDDGGGCALELYRFAAGEANPDQEREFRLHLAQCPRCQEDLELFGQAGRDSERELERGAAPGVERSGPWRGWRWLGIGLAPAAVAAALLLLLVRPPEDDDRAAFKIKGGYSLQVAVQRGMQRFSGVSGADYQDGDVLGFFYTAPEPRYLTLMFSDGRGEITRIYPTDTPVQLPAGAELPLPDGAVLEPGVGCEWIVAVFTEEVWPPAQIEQELRRAVTAQPDDCRLDPLQLEAASVDVFILRREQP